MFNQFPVDYEVVIITIDNPNIRVLLQPNKDLLEGREELWFDTHNAEDYEKTAIGS